MSVSCSVYGIHRVVVPAVFITIAFIIFFIKLSGRNTAVPTKETFVTSGNIHLFILKKNKKVSVKDLSFIHSRYLLHGVWIRLVLSGFTIFCYKLLVSNTNNEQQQVEKVAVKYKPHLEWRLASKRGCSVQMSVMLWWGFFPPLRHLLVTWGEELEEVLHRCHLKNRRVAIG